MNQRSLMALVVMLVSIQAYGAELKSNVYGYIDAYVEKVEKQPGRSGGTATTPGTVTRSKNPHEFDTPNIVTMIKSNYKTYSAFLNLRAASSAGAIEVRNAWVESKLLGNDLLKFRFGTLYRPFGLYNERLDAVPTYIGIEPPELFDKDHLLLTRTTNLMLHGEYALGSDILRYSLTSGNDERFGGEVPVGGDIRYIMFGSDFEWTIGSSFYLSNAAVYSSSGTGGVLKHMKSDKYDVFGFFTELKKKSLLLQAAYFTSNHDGVRNGATLQDTNAFSHSKLNQRQIDRLCGGDCSTATDSIAKYDIQTWYLRAGYSMELSFGELVPYIQYDYYSNPEIVADKASGGDKEAGISDDGKFTKQTIGVVYRPEPVIAFKTDISNHSQKVNGKDANYAEARFSFSYIWSL